MKQARVCCAGRPVPRTGLSRAGHGSPAPRTDAILLQHETITQVSIRAVRAALARSEGRALCERVNALLQAEEGRRDWPLRFYSGELLFSREARLGWAEPDRAPLPLWERGRTEGCARSTSARRHAPHPSSNSA